MTTVPAILFYLALLILPIAALAARRIPGRIVIKYAMIWVAIFALGTAALTIAR